MQAGSSGKDLQGITIVRKNEVYAIPAAGITRACYSGRNFLGLRNTAGPSEPPAIAGDRRSPVATRRTSSESSESERLAVRNCEPAAVPSDDLGSSSTAPRHHTFRNLTRRRTGHASLMSLLPFAAGG